LWLNAALHAVIAFGALARFAEIGQSRNRFTPHFRHVGKSTFEPSL
jgi:hypothetical protein